MAKQDITDQKKITDSAFNGIETLHMCCEYLRTESIACRKWQHLLFVTDAKGEKVNILDSYMRLSAVDLKEASRT